MALKDWEKIKEDKWERLDGNDEIGIYESDEELKKASGGEKYFVSYANQTKMKMFKIKLQAISFVKEYIRKY